MNVDITAHNKSRGILILISFVLLTFIFSGSLAADEWSEKELILPTDSTSLVRNFSKLNFELITERQDHSQKVNFFHEFLAEEFVDGDEVMKIKHGLERKGAESQEIIVKYDNNFIPIFAESDGQEINPDMTYQYVEPVLNSFAWLQEVGFTDFPELEYEFVEKDKEKIAEQELNIYQLTVPENELSGEVMSDLSVKLIEFENSLAVYYYSLKVEDVDELLIEMQVESIAEMNSSCN